MMQDGDAEDAVDRRVRQRQIVCGADDELGGVAETVQRDPARREREKRRRDVHADDPRAPAGEQQRVLAGSAAEVEDGAAGYVAEQRVRVLEGIDRVERRVEI